MARQRKYPLWPGPKDDEVPYDTEHFKRWLVNEEGMTISTANSYVSSIRTAFFVMFADDDATFKNLRNAFLSRNIMEPERRIARLEDEYNRLEAYLWAINEFGDITLDEFNSKLRHNQEKSAPKDMWVTAFQAYIRYIRRRIDMCKEGFGMRVSIEDNNKLFLDMPLSRQYRSYLKNLGAGYARNSVDIYYTKLKRLYNLLFRRSLKKNVIPFIESYIERGIDISPLCDKLKNLIEREIEVCRFEDLSSDDLTRGGYAFQQYCNFLKDYADNPGKYPKEVYEIPLTDAT